LTISNLCNKTYQNGYIWLYLYRDNISNIYIVTKTSTTLKKKRLWVRSINVRQPLFGDFQHLFQELKEDDIMFFKYTRMNLFTFNKLLDILRSHLEKRNWRALSAEQAYYYASVFVNVFNSYWKFLLFLLIIFLFFRIFCRRTSILYCIRISNRRIDCLSNY